VASGNIHITDVSVIAGIIASPARGKYEAAVEERSITVATLNDPVF
jgi:hypothetical protein